MSPYRLSRPTSKRCAHLNPQLKPNLNPHRPLIALAPHARASAWQVHEKPLNGKLTCGENIADLGGLKLAYRALRKLLSASEVTPLINGFTPEQRFFLAWAQVPPAPCCTLTARRLLSLC